MARPYTLKRRAEQQSDTRRRIAAAAVELHGTVGPAQTTTSMIAERAGVQRHTVYAHFPDERALQMACSGLVFERDPLPDPAAFRDIADARARLTAGLAALYGWFARNADLAAHVLRDAEHHALTRETVQLRFGPTLAAYEDDLGEGLTPVGRAQWKLALSFFTWRTLVAEAQLPQAQAVDVLVTAAMRGGT